MSIVHRLLHAGEGKKRKLLESLVPMVNGHESAMERLSDAELAHKTVEFRERLAQGEELDELIPEGFATVREAARRVLGQRHYDVQIMGGVSLHFGWISEMKTGEGKTLVSTLPAYLNGLTSKGVHLVTVNDYLASRDAEWMGGVHRFLGLAVGLIQTSDDPWTRKPAYAADITYGTNNEFGFDYLRDNMAMDPDERVQRGHNFAIVDEVDSILIDEARTPLIISGRVSESARWYQTFARIVPKLARDEDYEVDEKKRIVAVNESGITKVEEALGIENLYDNVHSDLVHHLTAALKAKELFKREVEYIVRNGEVLIVDEFTGRILDGRRYSEGLHQAIEAKEGVRVKEENQTLATITLQNYFRLYDKLAGMTGTAETEAAEFKHTYKLEVVSIPTHRTMVRDDESDLVYKTAAAKWDALIEDIKERNEAGQPILVGTVSIEKNEHLAKLLTRAGVRHQLLNAKQHEREASVIAQAGRKGSVTVATNMAGRGVDIILGGNPEHIALEEMRRREIGLDEDPELFQKIREEKDAECRAEREEVLSLGGLYVIGTERHESRRIDNQLRGRSGRQGDPGESRFFLSLEDDLMRLFAADTISNLMTRLKVPDDVPIEAKIVSKAIERAQKQVEERNFEIRKNILKYDEVMTKQREIIYRRRQQILDGEDMHQDALDAITEALGRSVRAVVGETYPEEWDLDEIRTALLDVYPCTMTVDDLEELRITGVGGGLDAVAEEALDLYAARESELGGGVLGDLERQVMLSVLDNKWREHLYDMDYLEEGINLRAFAGTDPLVAYQAEGYDLFGEMLQMIEDEFARYMYRVQVIEEQAPRPRQVQAQHTLSSGAQDAAAASPAQVRSHKVGRNAPCPCGSGKKTKLCHPENAN